MTTYTLTLLEEQYAAIGRLLFEDRSERAVIVVCGRSRHVDPWTKEVEERFLGKEIIEVGENAFVERSPTSMTWSTTPFYRQLKRTEPADLGLAVFHSHPEGPLEFSKADDVAEAELFEIAFNRLESERPHLSVIMDGNGDLVARAYGRDLKPRNVRLIRVIGHRWRFWYHGRGASQLPVELDRQVRAFGAASTEDLRQLRVAIVGCGGTGSAVASLLARLGIRHVALFDTDCVDDTSLNRLHFSTRTDANLGELKVDVVGRGIASIGLPVSVVRLPYAVDDERSRDAIRSCDIVFGCTDDHLGRNFLNRLAHFYLIPVVDVGLLIEPNDRGGYDVFDGRVTVVQPGYVCQVCRGLVRSEQMLAEGLRRNDPATYERRRRAGYVPNAPDPSPVVVTFTVEVAAMAVNEVFQRLTGFRGDDGSCSERVRRFDEVKDTDTVPGGRSQKGCRLCSQRRYDGRGDMVPFLDQTA